MNLRFRIYKKAQELFQIKTPKSIYSIQLFYFNYSSEKKIFLVTQFRPADGWSTILGNFDV